jgi:quinol monooxygenase YgiN
MPVVTTAEYVVMTHIYVRALGKQAGRIRTHTQGQDVRIRPDLARPRGEFCCCSFVATKEITVLVKVFPIKLKDGRQEEVEAIVREFAPKGPESEAGTLSFRVYRDPAKPDYLLFVEHFADQAAYDQHTSSAAYQDLIAGRFAERIVEFTEMDHQLVVSV